MTAQVSEKAGVFRTAYVPAFYVNRQQPCLLATNHLLRLGKVVLRSSIVRFINVLVQLVYQKRLSEKQSVLN